MCRLSFQPVLHDWCKKGHGMCYPVWDGAYKRTLAVNIGKSSLCGGSGFPLSLSEWSLTICLTPYNCKKNVLSVSLNKTFPSFLTCVQAGRTRPPRLHQHVLEPRWRTAEHTPTLALHQLRFVRSPRRWQSPWVSIRVLVRYRVQHVPLNVFIYLNIICL